MADPMLPNPVIVPETPGGAGGVQVDPNNPNAVTSTSPDAPSLAGSSSASTTPNPGTGMAPLDLSALKWLAALFLLWVILTLLTEWSDQGKMLGRAFAGLVLVGATYKLGPQAIANVQNVWTGSTGTTGTTTTTTTTTGG